MGPEQYTYIAAWFRSIGYPAEYAQEQQSIAAEENAPADALYRRGDGTWRCRHHLKDTQKGVVMALDRDVASRGFG